MTADGTIEKNAPTTGAPASFVKQTEAEIEREVNEFENKLKSRTGVWIAYAVAFVVSLAFIGGAAALFVAR